MLCAHSMLIGIGLDWVFHIGCSRCKNVNFHHFLEERWLTIVIRKGAERHLMLFRHAYLSATSYNFDDGIQAMVVAIAV